MRTKGSIGSFTKKRIWAAAIDLIAEHGFEAVSMRDLAAAVGIQAPSLYRHIRSKQQLLFDIMVRGQRDLLGRLQANVLSEVTPTAQLTAFVTLHLDFFVSRPNEVRVVFSELKSLTPLNRIKLIGLRDQYDQALKDILVAGVQTGAFEVSDVSLTEKLIVNMLSGIQFWYKPGGRLTRDQLIAFYVHMVFRLVRPGVVQLARGHVRQSPRPLRRSR